jgi:DNA-binding XRE family transcriptional regulator
MLRQISDADDIVANSLLLLKAAKLLGHPALFVDMAGTEPSNAMPTLEPFAQASLHSESFDATRACRFHDMMPATASTVLMLGAETHAQVMQTGFSLLRMGRTVAVVRDAGGSRRAPDKEAALERLAQRGAEIVTAEMAVLEWLEDAHGVDCQDAWDLVSYARPARNAEDAALEQRSLQTAGTHVAAASELEGWQIGPLLRRARLEQSLTLTALAERANCSPGQLSKIETGKTVPSLPVLLNLSRALGRSLNSFLKVNPGRPPPQP